MASATEEDYLRAMHKLERKGKVTITELAEMLSLAKSSVSEMVQELGRRKLVKYERYVTLELTEEGRKVAQHVTYKHRIIEVFLHEMLKMPMNQIHEEAHRLEHAFSDDAIRRLSKVLGNPKTDPHGSEIKKVLLKVK